MSLYMSFFSGAYYYYNTETNKTYEQTIRDVHDYATQKNIPYKYASVILHLYCVLCLHLVTYM